MGKIRYPVVGEQVFKRRPEKILLLCCFERIGVPSIVEIVEFIQRLSAYPVTVLNLYEHRTADAFLTLPENYDWSAFDVIIIHNTVAYNVDTLRALDTRQRVKLKDYEGVKIILKQDDHFRFREAFEFIQENKIDVIFTLTPPSELPKVYPIPEGSEIRIRHMLAAYVTPAMREIHFTENRPIDIGYRGSIMPLSFGRLCYEKRRIGDEVQRRLAPRGDVRMNISSRWEDRIGGDEWAKFLRTCTATLGVESGSGIFDLDGSLAERCKRIEEELGPFSLDHDYAEAYLSRLSDLEDNVRYFMISPRHFEAISNGSVQILFPGEYTGRMKAGVHYLELKRDYSNLDMIVDAIKSPSQVKAMASRAFEEVILDRRNWIEAFVEQIDQEVEAALIRKGRTVKTIFQSAPTTAKHILLIQAHEHGCDSRRDDWIPNNAGQDLRIHQLVIDRKALEPSLSSSDFGSILSVPLAPWDEGFLSKYGPHFGFNDPVFMALSYLSGLNKLTKTQFAASVGGGASSARIDSLRWYIGYILTTTRTLCEAANRVRGFSAIIAINLPTLFAAHLLKKLHGAAVIYEALEYWPEADPDSEQFEIDFWSDLERLLVADLDQRGTVTPGLANLMMEKYGQPFDFVPNCCGRNEGMPAKRPDEIDGRHVRFLFHGNFAPYRGLEALIEAFGDVSDNAFLYLRGPESHFKLQMIDKARNLGLLDRKVFFLAPVDADNLVQSSRRDADVGVIPYPPKGENYRNCSPNKMGQYFAAALPILANRTNYVAEIVENAQSGKVIEFTDLKRLRLAINEMADDVSLLTRFSSNAERFFTEKFNWQVQSRAFYAKVSALASAPDHRELEIFTQTADVRLYPEFIEAVVPPKPRIGVHWRAIRAVWRTLLPLRIREKVNPLLASSVGRTVQIPFSR